MAFFGLDIGSYSIKLAQAEKKGKAFSLRALGEIRTPIDLNSESEKDKLTLIEAIKKLVSDVKPTTKKVALSLSENNIYSQIINFPYFSERELASAINFEAEQYIPIPLEEVKLDYLILKKPPKGASQAKMEVLLVAVKKSLLKKMADVVEKAGLVPIAAETESLALNRSLVFDFSKTGVILDLGFRSTNIIIKNQNLKFIRNFNTGGEALTRSVASTLNMDFTQAEQYKINYGINENQLEGKVAQGILSVLSIIVNELKKGIAFFKQSHPEQKIDFIILTGGGAEMPGLSSYLAKSFNLEVLIADSFAKFVKDEKLSKVNHSSRFSVVSGLSLREENG